MQTPRQSFAGQEVSRAWLCEGPLGHRTQRQIAPEERNVLSTGLDGCWLEIAGRRLSLPPVLFRRALFAEESGEVEASSGACFVNPDGNGGAMGKSGKVYGVRLGNIHATVWRNESEDGSHWFRVSITRRYKNGDEWADSNSYSRDELPVVQQAASMAYAWIWEQEAVIASEVDEAEKETSGRASKRKPATKEKESAYGNGD